MGKFTESSHLTQRTKLKCGRAGIWTRCYTAPEPIHLPTPANLATILIILGITRYWRADTCKRLVFVRASLYNCKSCIRKLPMCFSRDVRKVYKLFVFFFKNHCSVSFRCTEKWFSYTSIYICMCIYVYIYVCVIYIYINKYIYILFQILFPYRLLENIEYSSLRYTVGPCWLSILYIVVWIC